jgi:hypothetical protein
MDDPIEKDYASFQEKLKTSSPKEKPSLYLNIIGGCHANRTAQPNPVAFMFS